jgi:hypothetical protein
MPVSSPPLKSLPDLIPNPPDYCYRCGVGGPWATWHTREYCEATASSTARPWRLRRWVYECVHNAAAELVGPFGAGDLASAALADYRAPLRY